MKTLLLAFFLLSTSAFAETFTTNQQIIASTGESLAPAKVEINILSLNPYNRTILLDVNGKVLETKITRVQSEDSETESSFNYAFKANILRNVLQSGAGCDESESFSMQLSINVEVSKANGLALNSLTALTGTYETSSDICHDFPNVKLVNYVLN